MHVVPFVDRTAMYVRGRSRNGRGGDLSIEPLPSAPAEAQKTQHKHHADHYEADDDEDTSDGAFVGKEAGSGSTA